MEILTFKYEETPSINERIVLCLGFFDGVHLGHQSLIKKALNEGYKVGVLSFDNSPGYVLGKTKENFHLTSNSDKAELFEQLGVDYFFLMHFDENVATLSKEDFVEKVLKVINPVKIYCGKDFRFGNKGEGDPEFLRNFFEVNDCDFILCDDEKISTRKIVGLVEEGDMEKVKKRLGRYFRINGLVVEGKHNGRSIDFPTANLELDYPYVFPKVGAYTGYAEVAGERYRAIISVGTHPSVMQLLKPIIEVHILEFDGNLYGKDIFVEFAKLLREEKVFASLDELKEQLQKDKKIGKRVLKILEERENNKNNLPS